MYSVIERNLSKIYILYTCKLANLHILQFPQSGFLGSLDMF